MKKLYFIAVLLFACVAGKAQTILLTGKLIYNVGCDSPFIRVSASAYTSSMRLVTWWGDGSSKTDTFFSNTPYRCYTSHRYATSGVYTVKHVITVGGTPVDSMSYSDTVAVCRSIHILSYVDNNGNCIYDAGDTYLPGSYHLEIDSSGIPIDTLVGTSFNYTANALAATGTVYTFKVISKPPNRHVSCPTSGILRDTLGTSTGQLRFGFACDSPGFDLAVYGWFRGGVTGACAHVYAYNARCSTQAATVTLNYSPKYTYNHVYPSSVGVTTGSGFVTLNMGTPNSVTGCIVYFTPVGTPSLGDTTHTTWTVNPVTGDARPANNTLYRVDSIHTAYDPNDKAVTPEGMITAGTNLEYKIGFENLGSDTAFNIHVMDTLSDNLDVNTLQVVTSSAEMFTEIYNWNGHTVVKFDFPHIHLLDTTHAGKNTGMVMFTINTKSGLPNGTVIPNKAGIYFDANPVVMTNTVYNTIGTVSTGTGILTNSKAVSVYPNPVGNELRISDEHRDYNTWMISDAMGKVLREGTLDARETLINTTQMVPGIYQLLLKGPAGTKAIKLQKM
jgi:uncharacterized repeat protein (TIGR01451 family)